MIQTALLVLLSIFLAAPASAVTVELQAGQTVEEGFEPAALPEPILLEHNAGDRLKIQG